ncbi:MAG: translation initiation factor IF-2 [Chloroflexi bacterium]|nr:translation initiation factor IF-2 [Chloroflexota bacterium]
MSEKVEETQAPIELSGSMTVRGLAESLDISPIDVIKTLMANGVMANINQQIDFETAEIVATEMGFEVFLETVDKLEAEDIGEVPLWRRLIASEDKKDLESRPPVVTILGHVDHGKTTLLDAIRKTSVASGEAGGITQHISAYQVEHNGRSITFLDTPGHAAFTAMRSRGAQGADLVILVVAADDGVMPQTKEALAHARAAKVPMVVAMTKIDKENANPDLVKQQLADAGLVPDDWDGDTIVVPVSGTKGTGLEDLLEAILLVADNTEILANPNGQVIGTVIEASRDQSRGVVATLLIQNGTLSTSDILVAGTAYGKLRAMFDYQGNPIKEAGPSSAISVMGLKDVPQAGDMFRVVGSDKEARTIVAERKEKKKQATSSKGVVTLENMFERYQAGEARELRLIIKADVQGSLDPIVSSLQEMSAADKEGDIGVNVLHSLTGNIGENDVMLATASKAIIMGFNVKADNAALRMAERDGVTIRTYDVIYRLTEDVEKALKGMLEPEEIETVIGKAEVRAVFKISRLGTIAGCRVIQGEIRRSALIRVLREDKVIFDGEITTLKHEKDSVSEVREGFECGISAKEFNKFKEGDIIEAYIREFVAIE